MVLRKITYKNGDSKLKFRVKPLRERIIVIYCSKCGGTRRFNFAGKKDDHEKWRCKSCNHIYNKYNEKSKRDECLEGII